MVDTRQAHAAFQRGKPGILSDHGHSVTRGRDFTAQDTYESPIRRHHQRFARKAELWQCRSYRQADPMRTRLRQVDDHRGSGRRCAAELARGNARASTLHAHDSASVLRQPDSHRIAHAGQSADSDERGAGEDSCREPSGRSALHDHGRYGEQISRCRTLSRSVSSFAAVGLLLAMLGIYGTMAYSVIQRRFEIGIRLAFGANKAMIMLDVVKSAAWLAVWGIAIGLALSLVLTRSLTAMLADVRPADPASIGGAALILMATALLAGLAPGRRAMRVEPMTALRAGMRVSNAQAADSTGRTQGNILAGGSGGLCSLCC